MLEPKRTTVKATLSLQQLKSGLKKRFDSFKNVTIRSELSETIINGRLPEEIENPTEIQSLLGDKKLAFPWMRAIFRYDGERCYYQLVHPSYHDPDDVKLTETIEEAWNGKHGTRLENIDRTALIVGYKTCGVQRNPLLEHVYWPGAKIDLKDQDNLYLPESIHDSQTQVRQFCETVSGVCCHVIEVPGLDEIWIDVDRNFAVVMRRRRFRSDGPMRVVASNRDWQEVCPAVWLPRSSKTDYYCGPDRPPTMQNTVSTSVSIESEFSSTPLTTEDFTISFPENTLVYDETKVAE